MRKLLMFGILLALRTAVIFAQGSPIVTQQYGNGLGGGVHTYLIASTPADDGGDYDHLHLVTTFNCNDYAGCNSTLDATFGNRGGFLGVYTVKGAYSAQSNVRLVAYRDSSSVTYIYLILADYYDLVTYTVLESIDDSVYPNPTDLGNVTPPGTLVFDTSNPAYPPANYTDFAGDFVTTGKVGVGTTALGGWLSVVADSPAAEVGAHIVNTDASGYSALRLGVDATAASGGALHQFNSSWSGDPASAYPPLGTTLTAFASGGLVLDSYAAAPIRFFTGGTAAGNERMRILPSGNVGIGNIAPSVPLEVGGPIKIDSGGLIFPDGSSLNSASALAGTSLPSNIVSSSLTSVGTLTSGVWNGTPLTAGYLPNDVVSTDVPQTITGRTSFSNNVGIGTTDPPSSLAVLSNTAGINGETLALQHTGSGDVGLSFQQTSIDAFGIVQRSGAGSGLAFIHNYYEGSSGTEVMRILDNGNVGIGTASPDQPLTVTGNDPAVEIQNIATGGTEKSYFATYPTLAQFSYNRVPSTGAIPNISESSAYLNLVGGSSYGAIQLAAGAAPNVQPTAILTANGNGNVGIDTINPGASLEVNGGIKLTQGTTAGLTFGDTTTQRTAYPGTTTALPSTLTASSLTSVGTVTTGTWNASPITSSYLPADIDYTDQAQTISGQKTFTSNVGIGTSTPQAKLDVTGSIATDVTGTENEFQLTRQINNGISYPQVAAFQLGTWNTSGACCGPQTRLDINLKANPDGNLTGDTNVMSLLSNGSVGIGTSSPGAKLEVNGGISLTPGSNGAITFPDGTSIHSAQFLGGSGGTSGTSGTTVVQTSAGGTSLPGLVFNNTFVDPGGGVYSYQIATLPPRACFINRFGLKLETSARDE